MNFEFEQLSWPLWKLIGALPMWRNAPIPEGCRKPHKPSNVQQWRLGGSTRCHPLLPHSGLGCDFQSKTDISLRIQELHQLLTYGGMSKSGNKPTLQVSLQSNLFQYSLCIQKRALEMVENSRDPNMSTKIQELSRQVRFTLPIWVRSAISSSENDVLGAWYC